MVESAEALSLDNLAYSSWMVRTRTESSSAEAFSSMAFDFFLPEPPAVTPPLLGAAAMPPELDRPGICMILGSGMMMAHRHSIISRSETDR